MKRRSFPVDGATGGAGRIVVPVERDGKRHGPQMNRTVRGGRRGSAATYEWSRPLTGASAISATGVAEKIVPMAAHV